ncbi:MAG: CHAD domain-containing protein, partial [Thalassobaculaceae bacterium]
MSVETEIKFLLSAPVARALSRDLFPAASAREDHLDTTYFDTPAGHLEAARVALRLRRSEDQVTQTIKTAAPTGGPFSRGEVERVLTAPRLVLEDLKQVLSPQAFGHVTRAGVAPTFRTVFDRQRRLIRHTARSGGVSTIELALDRGHIDTNRANHPICELELELKSGPPEGLLDLAGDLQSRYGLRLSIDSKAARAARLRHGAAPDICRARPLNFTAKTRIADAYPAIVRACLTQFIANHENVLEVGAPEAIHQMRVSIRRLRSANTVFQPIIAAGAVAPALTLLKEVFEALGRVRNIDVLIAETFDNLVGMGLQRTQLAQLTPHLTAWRERELARVRAVLEAGAQWQAVLQLALWVETGTWR